MTNKKIFVIGFNKTGTTSFHFLFKKLGINSSHNWNIPVIDEIDDYDAFTDRSHDNFREYYYKYPNSLFILNTRPLKNWIISRYKHARNENWKESWCWPISLKKTLGWINHREKLFTEILNFFKDKPDKLILVNIEKENWQDFIVKKLKEKNYKIEEMKNIKVKSNVCDINNVREYINNIEESVNKYLEILNKSKDELFIKNLDINDYLYDKYL